MKNIIAIAAYNRPKYLALTVDAINKTASLGEFESAFVSIDRDVFGDTALAVWREANRLAIPAEIFQQTERVGCAANVFNALYRAFALGDYVVMVEDDVVLSPDALRFVLWARDKATFVQLFSRNKDQSAKPNEAELVHHFNPLGFGCSLSTFQDHVLPGWSERLEIPETRGHWSLGMHAVMAERKLTAIRPKLSRSRNIGREGGTHDAPEYYDEHWTGFNFCSESYTGEYTLP